MGKIFEVDWISIVQVRQLGRGSGFWRLLTDSLRHVLGASYTIFMAQKRKPREEPPQIGRGTTETRQKTCEMARKTDVDEGK